MSAVDVRELGVDRGGTTILEDVSCSVDRGEFVGVVGPNGAGKTTLLRTVSAAIEPTRGAVTVEDRDVTALSSRASSRLVAVVPQDPSISFTFPVRDVVAMGRYPHRSRFAPASDRDRALVDRALERTGTAQFADRSIESLSGGERQRVLIARAIAQDTPVMLFDEPTASLDINHQVQTLDLLRSLADDGVAVVAAIHDLDHAGRYCDRLLLLDDGHLRRRGPPSDVLTGRAIADTFDVTTGVSPDTFLGSPRITALTEVPDGAFPDSVHVVGSGATACRVLATFATSDVAVTVGPLVPTSPAVAVAERIGYDTIQVDPFGPLSDSDIDRLETATTCADLVLAALEPSLIEPQVLEAIQLDTPAVVIESKPIADPPPAYDRLRERATVADPNDWPDAMM